MIFLDNASTTKIYKEALSVYVNANNSCYYNPSALYKQGSQVLKEINNARSVIMQLLGGGVFDNLIFTSGATESNNLAITGVVKKKGKFLFSNAEHPSVYNVAKHLASTGYSVEFVNVTKDGVVDEDDFAKKVIDATFVSVIHVSNETGAINNIKKLVKIAKEKNKNIVFHSDGVQAFGKIKVDVLDLGVDLYTISAHKIHGPKGMGALYIKNKLNVKPNILGGGQEFGIRSGTENTGGVLAFKKACEMITNNLEKNHNHASLLKQTFLKLLSNNLNIVINSHDNCSPYIVSLAILGVPAETILHMASQHNILISNGSACSSKNSNNRILTSMGVQNNVINSSIRVSFSEFNTVDEVAKASKIISEECLKYIEKIK